MSSTCYCMENGIRHWGFLVCGLGCIRFAGRARLLICPVGFLWNRDSITMHALYPLSGL